MSDAIVLDVLSSSPVQLDAGDADPIAREEIAELATRVTTVEGDVSGLSTRVSAAEGDISTLGTTVDGIDARVEAIEADYVTAEDVMGALGGEAPTLVSGSSRAVLGDAETASWMQRTTAEDGAALIEAIYGNTLRWNQLNNPNVGTRTSQIVGITLTVTASGLVSYTGTTQSTGGRNLGVSNAFDVVSGHKYLIRDTINYPSNGGGVWHLTNVSTGTVITGNGVVGNSVYTAEASARVYIGRNFTATGVEYDCSGYVSVYDLTAMFGSGNEPATVAEFEAMFPEPYYPYDPGSLLPVRMEGVETVAADESWSSEQAVPAATYFPQGMRSAGTVRDELRADAAVTRVGAVDLGTLTWTRAGNRWRSADLVGIIAMVTNAADMPNIIAEKYEAIPATGSLDNNHDAITVIVGGPTTGQLYTYADDSTPSPSGLLHYALATPTTTPIDPPLPLSYRVGAGGTERVMVASGITSAPPIFATRYPLDPADLAASIAPVDGPIAKTNHQVGDLLMLGFTLCKATQVIVTGETIAIGTNVTKTTVAAELAALSE